MCSELHHRGGVCGEGEQDHHQLLQAHPERRRGTVSLSITLSANQNVSDGSHHLGSAPTALLRLQVWPGGRSAQDPVSLWSSELPQVDELISRARLSFSSVGGAYFTLWWQTKLMHYKIMTKKGAGFKEHIYDWQIVGGAKYYDGFVGGTTAPALTDRLWAGLKTRLVPCVNCV